MSKIFYRETVRIALGMLDPVGVERRKNHKLIRRKYRSKVIISSRKHTIRDMRWVYKYSLILNFQF